MGFIESLLKLYVIEAKWKLEETSLTSEKKHTLCSKERDFLIGRAVLGYNSC